MQREGFPVSGPVSENVLQTNWLNESKAGTVADGIK